MWQSLSTEELDKLGQLLDSDYWQKNRRIRQLGLWLLGYAPAFTSPKLTREAAWRQVAAGTPYVDQKLNNLLSDLLLLRWLLPALGNTEVVLDRETGERGVSAKEADVAGAASPRNCVSPRLSFGRINAPLAASISPPNSIAGWML